MKYHEFMMLETLFDMLELPCVQPDENWLRVEQILLDNKIEFGFTPEAIHKAAWDLLRKGYEQEKLLDYEKDSLRELFEHCEPCHYDDLRLADFGDHRMLYDYITKVLNLDCEMGRGPAYRRAALLLGEKIVL